MACIHHLPVNSGGIPLQFIVGNLGAEEAMLITAFARSVVDSWISNFSFRKYRAVKKRAGEGGRNYRKSAVEVCNASLEKEIIKEDQELYRLVQTKLSLLYELLARTQGALLWALCEETVELYKIIECNYSRGSIGANVSMYSPLCNEHSFDDLFEKEETQELGDLNLSLLKNNLALGCADEDSGKGDGVFEEIFLCTEIEDDESP